MSTGDASVYATSDLNLAAYLMLANVLFIRTTKEGRRSIFHFEKGPDHDRLVSEYFNAKGRVSVNDYAARLRDVKTVAHFRIEDDEFLVSDMYVAAYLMLGQIEVKEVRREGPRSLFVFDNLPELQKLITEFYNGDGKLPATQYAQKIEHVKSMAHSAG